MQRFIEQQWQDLCSRTQRSADYFAEAFPQHRDAIQQQSDRFCNQPVPSWYPELLDRVREAAEMAVTWSDPDMHDRSADEESADPRGRESMIGDSRVGHSTMAKAT